MPNVLLRHGPTTGRLLLIELENCHEEELNQKRAALCSERFSKELY